MSDARKRDYDELIARTLTLNLEKLDRPIRKGTELSRCYGELFDRLDENGYLHEGERELLMRNLVKEILKTLRESFNKEI
jgi:hypothetical protein